MLGAILLLDREHLNLWRGIGAGALVTLAQTAAVLSQDPGCLADSARPSPQGAPDVTVADLRYWIARGWYHPAVVPESMAGCQ
jgi:hypothetical protein